jgi:hypothetical protein
LPQQNPLNVNVEDSPLLAGAADVDEDEVPMEIRPTILTKGIITTWTEGEPGTVIRWQSHSPEMYQIFVNI